MWDIVCNNNYCSELQGTLLLKMLGFYDMLPCRLLLYCTLNYSDIHLLIAFQQPPLTIHHLFWYLVVLNRRKNLNHSVS